MDASKEAAVYSAVIVSNPSQPAHLTWGYTLTRNGLTVSVQSFFPNAIEAERFCRHRIAVEVAQHADATPSISIVTRGR